MFLQLHLCCLLTLLDLLCSQMACAVQRIPERILEKAIKGMLPKGRLGHRLFTHLKVFKGTKYPHDAQQAVDITSRINQKFNGASAATQ